MRGGWRGLAPAYRSAPAVKDKGRAPFSTGSGCKALAFEQLEAFLQAFCIVGLPPSDLTIDKMILTQCAVCATELGLTLGKKCGRCSTRYCGPECQVQHWKEGGHDQLCKKNKESRRCRAVQRK